MKIYNQISDFHKLPFAVTTLGTYDGVHRGHRKILARVIEIAKENGGESVVITFWPHPKKIINSKNQTDIKILSSLEEKTAMLSTLSIDHLLIIPFTREFSEYTSEDFIKKILVDAIGTKKLVIGYDHKFGKNREGSFENLKNDSCKYGFEVEEIPRQDIDDIGVSSTEIRKAIAAGEVKKAATYLEQPYCLSGIVVKGKKLGRTIGYPTANINVEEKEKLIPANGVYAVIITHKHMHYKGMLNIGYRPTVDGNTQTIEVNIFDFDKEIYGEFIEVQFIDFLRNEMKFSGLEELKKQLSTDKEKSLRILTNN